MRNKMQDEYTIEHNRPMPMSEVVARIAALADMIDARYAELRNTEK